MKTSVFLKSIPLLVLPALFSGCNPSYNDCCGEYEVVDETYIHRYGMPISQEHWMNEGQDGQVVSTRKDGVTIARSFEKGIPHGDTTYTYPHSENIERREIFQNGTVEREISYYPNAVPAREIVYGPDNSRLVNEWYENEAIKAKKNYSGEQLLSGEFYNPRGEVESKVENGQGEHFTRDEYGQILHKDVYQEGNLAQRTYFHSNNAPKEIVPYKGNMIEGTKRTYLPGGEPYTQATWVGDKQHGATIVYKNGERYAEIPYLSGQKNGVEKRFKEGTILTDEITWINGFKHGPSKHYVGNTIKTDWYFQDQPVSKIQFERLVNPPPK